MDEARARVARQNFARAGFAERASVVVGDAKVTIAKVAGPFDLIFPGWPETSVHAAARYRLVGLLLRPGGLLVTDNVLWDGEVAPGFVSKPTRDAADTRAIAEYNERINSHPALMTTTVPLRDGVAIAVKRGTPGTENRCSTRSRSRRRRSAPPTSTKIPVTNHEPPATSH